MKEKLKKKMRKIVNFATLVSLIFNVGAFTVYIPQAKADAPTPETQTLISPVDGESIDYDDLVFNWTEAVDSAAHSPVEYKFQVSTSDAVNPAPGSSFSGPIVFEMDWDEGLHDNFIDASDASMPLIPNVTYYWHVRAEDKTGGSLANRNSWSEVRSFTIAEPDLIPPAFEVISIKSDNLNNDQLATVGDTVLVSLTASEDISEPKVRIAGHDAVVLPVNEREYVGTYKMTATDEELAVKFEVFGYEDLAGNAGALVTNSDITDGSSVIFDMTGPKTPTKSKIETSNPTNSNNPVVSGTFGTDKISSAFVGQNNVPNSYEVKLIEVVFKNNQSGEPVDDVVEYGRNVVKNLQDYLTEGPVVKMVLEGVDAIKEVRRITGFTDPTGAEPGTIRGDLGEDSISKANSENRATKNLVHASGNPEEAEREIKLWFKD